MCDCEFTPYDKDNPSYGEVSWHYKRTCGSCKREWYGLHCKHDRYQNPCPSCGFKPIPESEVA